MKKIILLAFAILLGACSNASNQPQAKPEIEDKETKPVTDKERIFNLLEGATLKDNFNGDFYTRIDFEDLGNFAGNFLSNPSIDGFKSDTNDLIESKYAREETHKSVFSGSFSLEKIIKKGIYLLKAEDFKINNTVGTDRQMEYVYWVDFARGLKEGDRFILFLPNSQIDEKVIENSQYKEMLAEENDECNDEACEADHDHHDHDDDHNHNDHDDNESEPVLANGFVLYNLDQKIIYSQHDKWAKTGHHHH